jgi:hypothetical protein
MGTKPILLAVKRLTKAFNARMSICYYFQQGPEFHDAEIFFADFARSYEGNFMQRP